MRGPSMPTINQLIRLVDFYRRQDIQVFGVLLNRNGAGLETRIEVGAKDDSLNGNEFDSLLSSGHCSLPLVARVFSPSHVSTSVAVR